MTPLPVPRAALLLGLSGLIPFVGGTALVFLPMGTIPLFGIIESSPAGGFWLLERYGAAILAFMGGCLWGFAVTGERQAPPVLLALTTVPALIAVFGLGPTPMASLWTLGMGLGLLLMLDAVFVFQRLAPGWWLWLRIPLTLVAVPSLVISHLAGT
ncbi:MAG: DUF3429 domain-containing protein [Pseudomonadota bacterium]